MVNQKLYIMKQPELGRRISEMRKAKGLTQEELVEMCNLNVRTIQRIEAGEVTPRSYTIKALFEALGMTLPEENLDKEGASKLAQQHGSWYYIGLVAGLIYFVISYFEIDHEIAWLGGGQATPFAFIGMKVGVLISFSLFTYALIQFTKSYTNKFLQIALWIMLLVNAIWYSIDLLSLSTALIHIEDYYYVKVSSFGIVYALMGAGYLNYKNLWSHIPQIVGALGIVSGVLMFTVIGALFALIPLSLFELGEMGLLMYAITKIGSTSPDSNFSTEWQS